MREELEKKQFGLEVKEIDAETGTFEGWLSVYGNVDEGKDVVEPGAFSKTIKDNKGIVPLLWQHDTWNPIGKLELTDKEEGLWVKGKLVEGVQQADEAYKLLKNGIIRGLSIGYRTIKQKVEENVRHLKELKLYEGSLVTFPMNPSANIETVKSDLSEPKAADTSTAEAVDTSEEEAVNTSTAEAADTFDEVALLSGLIDAYQAEIEVEKES
jgi:HK97 family phage prohead protease